VFRIQGYHAAAFFDLCARSNFLHCVLKTQIIGTDSQTEASLGTVWIAVICFSALDVRFGSKADICGATSHVRFTPNSDRKSEFSQKVMSALPPKADMCGATRDVRYGPKADIARKKKGHQLWAISGHWVNSADVCFSPERQCGDPWAPAHDLP
jgi:hypothetical protein